MKLQQYLTGALMLTLSLLPFTTTAKGVKVPKMYMFGFAASFNDTIVHFTDIQAVDSVWVDNSNHFILGRENYSNMLRDYLTSQQMPNRTCIVMYDRKASRLQKKYLKMKKLYTGNKKVKTHNDVRLIGADEFRFTTYDMGTIEEETATKPAKKEKKRKP